MAVIPLGAKSPPPSCSLPAASLSEWAFSSPPIWPCSGGVCRAVSVAGKRGGLLPHHFTLTTILCGGLFSVALSVTALAVPRSYLAPCPWSPDFPQVNRRSDQPATARLLTVSNIARRDAGVTRLSQLRPSRSTVRASTLPRRSDLRRWAYVSSIQYESHTGSAHHDGAYTRRATARGCRRPGHLPRVAS